ncbi:MAG: phosphoribosylaminoimidazolesuccinocarboxamide synthase, partial [Phycisphaerae bacterium]|nr:phosphoribosylaminoimidazolesuccinocarboxamide synthase [Phycisphaerae bacterium]
MKTTALLTTSLENYPKRSGKVRDLYELSDSLLMVATDRISAYDVVMPNGIPDKGRVLTQISVFWFGLLGDTAKHHLLS